MPSHHAYLDDSRWWRGSGEEQCPNCLQFYFYEEEIRCPECDGPSCPHCVVRIQSATLSVCASCHDRDDQPEDS